MPNVFSYHRTASQNYMEIHPCQVTIKKQKPTNIDENMKSGRKKAYTQLIGISISKTTMEICLEDLQNIKT